MEEIKFETETIDKLFLELSQFAHAKTVRELQLEAKIKELEKKLEGKGEK